MFSSNCAKQFSSVWRRSRGERYEPSVPKNYIKFRRLSGNVRRPMIMEASKLKQFLGNTSFSQALPKSSHLMTSCSSVFLVSVPVFLFAFSLDLLEREHWAILGAIRFWKNKFEQQVIAMYLASFVRFFVIIWTLHSTLCPEALAGLLSTGSWAQPAAC